MYTTKRFTLILSAFEESNTLETNLNNTDSLKHIVELLTEEPAITATGCFEGETEQSFIIHTDSFKVLRDLAEYAISFFNQECVVISYNDIAEIDLFLGAGKAAQRIGSHFVPGKGNGLNYTTFDRKSWSVA